MRPFPETIWPISGWGRWWCCGGEWGGDRGRGAEGRGGGAARWAKTGNDPIHTALVSPALFVVNLWVSLGLRLSDMELIHTGTDRPSSSCPTDPRSTSHRDSPLASAGWGGGWWWRFSVCSGGAGGAGWQLWRRRRRRRRRRWRGSDLTHGPTFFFFFLTGGGAAAPAAIAASMVLRHGKHESGSSLGGPDGGLRAGS